MTTIVTNPEMIVPTNRMFKVWHLPELFIPGGGGGRYVPNKDDMAIEYLDDMVNFYQITDTNFTTGQHTREFRYCLPRSDMDSGRDIILSAAPGKPSDAFRAYVDNSVKPSTISIDTNLYFMGTMARYVRIFRGTDISDTGQVVSVMYDQSMNLLDEKIPLEEVATAKLPNAHVEQGMNTAIKIVATGYLTTMLQDNEVLTVVGYNDAGGVVRAQTVVVVNTTAARSPDAFRKFITQIAIDSPFISEGDTSLIVFPYNLPIDGVFANGVVTYSDGSKKVMAVDGTKFRLHGLNERRVSTQRPDVRFGLVLTYVPDAEEFYYGESIGEFRHISRRYQALTGPAEVPYSVKIYGYPQWMGPLTGYRMRYYLTNLARQRTYDITDKVRLGMNSPAFDGLLYGSAQHLIVTVDLGDVDSFYKPGTRHVQPISVVLREDGSMPGTIWTVTNDPGSPAFGQALKVLGDYISFDRTNLDVSMEAGGVADWLNKLFYAAGPMRNPETEVRAPEPTHFNLIVGGHKSEHLIGAFNTPLQVPFTPDPGALVGFEWIRRTGNGDLYLGYSAVAFYQLD